MHIYYSGVGKGVIEADERLGTPRYRLFSCHGSYVKYAKATSPIVAKIDDNYEIMLDSGAFTAWTKGEEVHLPHLVDVYAELVDIIGDLNKVWFINLDKIPGKPGETATEEQLAEAIKISDENYAVLNEKFPNRVLPVFHQNEDEARLKEVCDMSGGYVCISPRNDLGETYRARWAAETHHLLPEGIRTHGLAATGTQMMTKVPWLSVDSATWILIAAYGGIFIDTNFRIVGVSETSPTRHDKNAHVTTLADPERDYLYDLMKKWKFTLEELGTIFESRALWNRMMMTELYRSIGDTSHLPVQKGIFDL